MQHRITISWRIVHYRKQWLVVCHGQSVKIKKYSAKTLPNYTRQKAHASTVLANGYLPIVFYRALDKWFAECQIWHSAKKNSLLSVFQNTLGKRLLSAECFWELHSTNLFSKEFFFSAFCYCLTSVFGNYTRQTYFPKKKKFSAYFSLIAAIQRY